MYRANAVSAEGQSPRSTYVNVDTPAPPESESEDIELSEPEVPESEDGATQPEARQVWSSTLDAGLDASKFPPEVGYSPSAGGELSADTFTLDDTEHRVELLVSNAGGLYFGLSAELQTEFTLHVGEPSFESSASSTATVAPAVDVYWWDNSDLEWSGSETLDVSLRAIEGSSASSAERPSAP